MTTLETVMVDNARRILEYSRLPAAIELGVPEKPAIKRLAAIMDDTTTDETQKMNAIIEWMEKTSLGTDLR